jgi:hypothetical protein
MTTWTYQYVPEMLAFYRQARQITEVGGRIRLSWAGREYDAASWREQFRKALDRRINLKAGPEPCWRKLDDLYQTELRRDADNIRRHRAQRLAIHQITTPELKRRFGHLISSWED